MQICQSKFLISPTLSELYPLWHRKTCNALIYFYTTFNILLLLRHKTFVNLGSDVHIRKSPGTPTIIVCEKVSLRALNSSYKHHQLSGLNRNSKDESLCFKLQNMDHEFFPPLLIPEWNGLFFVLSHSQISGVYFHPSSKHPSFSIPVSLSRTPKSHTAHPCQGPWCKNIEQTIRSAKWFSLDLTK